VARELSETSALNQYIHAKLNLQSVLSRILDDYNVSIEEAKKGSVAREPDLPALTGAAVPAAPASGVTAR
jgi:hypothetical protein